MASLSPAEKIELGAIPVVAALTAWLVPTTGVTLELGAWVAGIALLILLQGLVRDLWLLRQARRAKSTSAGRAARCMCLESAMGLTGVASGIGLVGFGFARPIQLDVASLTLVVGAAITTGFLLKDLVFEWSPWKIHREKDHTQVIFRWRK